MIGKVNHILRRCREEGVVNSGRFLLKRLQAPARQVYLRRKYRNFHRRPAPALQADQTGRFFFAAQDLPAMAEWFRTHHPQATARITERANQIVAHRFDWLCPNSPGYGSRVEWFRDFASNREWPLTPYWELDFSGASRPGDIRELWELNRHQYFVTLGKAYILTGAKVYAEEFVAQLCDWVERNPPGQGINWLHAQEVAVRAVAWCWAYRLFAAAPTFSAAHKDLFFRALSEHADYIRWHLSDKPVTHNHLVTEACSLAVIGILFPQLPGASGWRDRGVRIFQREVLKQVWEDGLDGELSTNYHCFVLDSFLQLSLLMKINQMTVLPPVLKRIEAMIEAVMYFLRPDGSLPLIGDNDNGRAFRLTEQMPADRRAYLAIGAVLFERDDFRQVAGQFHEEAFWLLGIDGYRSFASLPDAMPASTERGFIPGGLLTSRTSWDQQADFLLMRGGPTQLRKGVSISHNHADLLSFELTLGGLPILIDPGVYLYGRDDAWRFHFRQTLAHNTLVVDGRDQFDVCATRFGIPHLPISTCHHFAGGAEFACFDMSHSGYAPFGIIHRRRLFWKKGFYLLVIDSLSGRGSHLLESHYHFSPAIAVTLAGSDILVDRVDGATLCRFHPAVGERVDATLISGATAPLQGWVAPRYGQKGPAPVVRYRCERPLPTVMATVIDLQPGGAPVTARVVEDEGEITCMVSGGQRCEQIRFAADGTWVIAPAAESLSGEGG